MMRARTQRDNLDVWNPSESCERCITTRSLAQMTRHNITSRGTNTGRVGLAVSMLTSHNIYGLTASPFLSWDVHVPLSWFPCWGRSRCRWPRWDWPPPSPHRYGNNKEQVQLSYQSHNNNKCRLSSGVSRFYLSSWLLLLASLRACRSIRLVLERVFFQE